MPNPSAGIKTATGAGVVSVESLHHIWQQVLRRPIGDLNDDFFDLGGDPKLASELFGVINQQFGLALAAERIYQAPTISSQMELLNSEPPKFPPIVLLKRGSQEPPIFIAHGVGATVAELFQVCRQIESVHPIYGLQSSGLEGSEKTHDRVEDMAHYHLAAIRARQPRGPYFLIGYSFGGLLMLEIAQILSAAGEKITLFVMIDSYPDVSNLSFGPRIQVIRQRALRKLLGSKAIRTNPASQSTRFKQYRESGYRALSSYKPQPYKGDVKFVRAQIVSVFPADPAPVWSPLVGRLAVESAPGDHHTMIAEYSEKLAAILSRYLHEAIENR